ncbi:MAG: dimethyl sulfoxide reductase anchor subunit [Rhodospirillales bacterium]|nr:dimethyl sulfoxide reductase anchor subunit [Rhodospirillales bacterium]
MHPAYSVILFTTASGAGYGLLVMLGIGAAAEWLPADRLFGFVAFAVALGAISFGLVASAFHLGRPERMWRAFSQWRSSWLSREGVIAVATYVPTGIFGIGWVILGTNHSAWSIAGLATAGFAAVTVACTAMIYRSLTTIPQWDNAWVVANYLALSIMTGAVLVNALIELTVLPAEPASGVGSIAIVVAYLIKRLYWRAIDTEKPRSTSGTATGLGRFGTVRQLIAPHTEENYVMREMGYRVARKHAAKLRTMASVAAFVLPMLCLAVQTATIRPWAAIPAGLAAVSALVGVLMERWLFFAEARHVVTLFYGAEKQ